MCAFGECSGRDRIQTGGCVVFRIPACELELGLIHGEVRNGMLMIGILRE